MIDPVLLKAEIISDPTGKGYAPFVASGQHNRIAAILNTVGTVDIDVEFVSGWQLLEAVSAADYQTMATGAGGVEKSRLWSDLVRVEQVRIVSPSFRSMIEAIWPAGSGTRTRLAALRVKKATRLEEISAVGEVASSSIVSEALRT